MRPSSLTFTSAHVTKDCSGSSARQRCLGLDCEAIYSVRQCVRHCSRVARSHKRFVAARCTLHAASYPSLVVVHSCTSEHPGQPARHQRDDLPPAPRILAIAPATTANAPPSSPHIAILSRLPARSCCCCTLHPSAACIAGRRTGSPETKQHTTDNIGADPL